MIDAIDVLLQGKQHPDAKELLDFHRAYPRFLPRVVAEFRLLKKQGRRNGSAKSIFYYLRWDEEWHRIDQFTINNNIRPLAVRVCAVIWPDVNGFVKLAKCPADAVLGTYIVTARKGRTFLRRTKKTGTDWLTAHRPEVPELTRPATLHRPIAEAEAAKSYTFFESVVAAAPKPRHPILLDWLRHVKAQPEIFAFLERTMLDRNPPDFSALSLVEYCRGSIQRAAERHKRFTLKNNFASFYCKALIMKNPEFNGRCEFRGDSNGKIRPGRANRLLGTSLAPEPINGEPYRRLIWNEVSR